MDNITLDSICGIKVYQEKKGYRFSLDSVLLAGFTKLTTSMKKVVDLGAGTGVVGLIIAQKHPWINIDMVEVQRHLVDIARKNIQLNLFSEKISVQEADISKIYIAIYPKLMNGGYDAVVTNPPFRKLGTGKVSPNEERSIARHELMMDIKDIMKASTFLLKNKGHLFLIYHPFRLSEMVHTMRTFSIEPKRMRFAHPTEKKEATMVLIEAVKGGGVELKVEVPLIIYRYDREYTDEVQSNYLGLK